jgi:hypothetical protein
VVLTAGLALGSFVLFVASHLNLAADAGQPTPSPITLAELMERGPGSNAHVELSEFRFGKPIIEPHGEQWRCVWIALEPTARVSPQARPVVLRLGDQPDQPRLDQLLTQKTLTAAVSTSMAHSAWDIPPDKEFAKAHPELDPKRVTLLQLNPNVEIGGITFLTEDMIFDRSNARIAKALGWSLLGLGLLSGLVLVWGLGRRPVKGPRPAPLANEEELRRQLLYEAPLSLHEFRLLGALGESFAFLFCAVSSLGATLFCLGAAGTFGQRSQPFLAGLAVLFALLMFAGVFLFLGLAIRVFTGGATRIGVFPSGLRWRTLWADRAALWSDIANVHRAVSIRNGVRMDTLEIGLYSGRTLRFSHRTLSDYETFAQTVSGQWNVPGSSRLIARPSPLPARGGKSKMDDTDWK